MGIFLHEVSAHSVLLRERQFMSSCEFEPVLPVQVRVDPVNSLNDCTYKYSLTSVAVLVVIKDAETLVSKRRLCLTVRDHNKRYHG